MSRQGERSWSTKPSRRAHDAAKHDAVANDSGLGNRGRLALLSASAPTSHATRSPIAVSSPDEASEREADAAATVVLGGGDARPALRVESGASLQRDSDGGGAGGRDTSGPGSADVGETIGTARGAGTMLPPGERRFFEERFGRNFGDVRVHRDGAAAEAAARVNAHAFTTGKDIFFGAGRFAPATPAGRQLLAHELAHVVQQRDVVQRKCRSCAEEEQEMLPIRRQATTSATTATPAAPVVDDEVQPGPGQMRRSDFMAELRDSLTAMCDAELAKVGHSADGCPYLQRWLDYYSTRPASALLRAIRLYAGAEPTDARDALALVSTRVLAAVRTWIATGRVVGVPTGVTAMPPAGGASGEEAGPGPALHTMEQPGSAGGSHSPGALRDQLGPGRPLDSGVRSRMERSFGSLDDVRVHDDPVAARLNSSLASRAFAVGNHVAFGGGEYRPGTIGGDLLLAHELAHTRQQGGETAASMSTASVDRSDEQSADRAALEALLGKRAQLPAGRGGLRLQRCVAAAAPEGAALLFGGAEGTSLVVGGAEGTSLLVGAGETTALTTTTTLTTTTAATTTTATGVGLGTTGTVGAGTWGTAAVRASGWFGLTVLTGLSSDTPMAGSQALPQSLATSISDDIAIAEVEADTDIDEDERGGCYEEPVCPHLGGNYESNACADYFAQNEFPGCDYYVGGKNFDAVNFLQHALYEVKVWNYSNYSPRAQAFALRSLQLEAAAEMAIAARCGYAFMLGVSDPQLYADIRDTTMIPVELMDC